MSDADRATATTRHCLARVESHQLLLFLSFFRASPIHRDEVSEMIHGTPQIVGRLSSPRSPKRGSNALLRKR